jgi:hypothetical protein
MSVKDNFNSYYTKLFTGLKESYSSIKGSTVYKATPPSFPHIYFKQIDGSTALTTLSSTEEGMNLGIEVQIYSSTSATDARKIANTTRGIMIGLGFTCSYFEPVENTGDTSIYRFVTRFEKLET